MIDHYLYFDRFNRKLRIYEEDCEIKSQNILRKRERILEGISINKKSRIPYLLVSIVVVTIYAIKKKIKN